MSSTDPRQQVWETIPLRFVCELNPSVAFDGLDEDEDLTFLPMDRVKGGYFIPNTDKFSKYGSSYTAFEDGDIVLAKVTPCFENGNIAIAGDLVGGKGFGSSELFVIRPTAAERRFLFYYFQSSIFKQDGEASMTGAGGLKRVSPDVLRQHHLPCPSQDIQRLIANYLDLETARIDGLIAEKERMLALLDEKRAALISRVVTRGLDPNAPLKPSGQEWLGEIPTHWDVLPLRWFISIGSGEFLSNELISNEKTEEMPTPVVGGNGVLGYAGEANTEDALVIGRVGALCGNVHFVHGPLWVTDNALLVQIASRFDPRYLREVLHLMKLNTLANQSAQPLITGEMVKSQKVPAPPIQEQEDILRILNNESGVYKRLFDELSDSTRLLKERRAALISAAVTGQIPLEEMTE